MTLSTEQKMDILWKSSKHVTTTSPTKQDYNEQFKSSVPVFQNQIWSDSSIIPTFAPGDIVPDPNAMWSKIMFPRKADFAAVLLPDPTSKNAWIAVKEASLGISEGNRIKNWIPPTIHRSYNVKVWSDNPVESTTMLEQFFPYDTGKEWEFDYSAGILYFPNELPSNIEDRELYIEGWEYIGGFGTSGSALGGGKSITSLTYTTPVLSFNQEHRFTLDTGGSCVLVECRVSNSCTLECSSLDDYTDTNPYIFVATNSQLFDDGSYVIAGQRFYGDRYINLINASDLTSGVTHWKITNNTNADISIDINVRVLSW